MHARSRKVYYRHSGEFWDSTSPQVPLFLVQGIALKSGVRGRWDLGSPWLLGLSPGLLIRAGLAWVPESLVGVLLGLG